MSSSHAHSVPAADLSARSLNLTASAGGLQVAALGVGVVALGLSVAAGKLGWFGSTETDLWRSWLQNFMFTLQIALGCLFFVFIQHLTRAGWSVAVRRPAEAIANNLTWIWVLFLPIAWLFWSGKAGTVFPWADLETLRANHPAEADLVERKVAYLNPSFFWIRATCYFAIWAILASFFLRTSCRLGRTGNVAYTLQMQKASTVTAILFGLTVTFAAFDWMMSLAPAWFSTMFGVYAFCGCATAGFAALILCCVRLQATGHLVGCISGEHYQDLGKFLFAFGMVFWAYIGFSQYMLIWYANIPEETGWFLARQFGDWAWLSLALLFGHFVVPFVGLISRWPKRNPKILAAFAVWMLAFAWLDTYWLTMPHVPSDLASFSSYAEAAEKYSGEKTHLSNPLNYLVLVGMLGVFVGMTVKTLRGNPLLCERDPRLEQSLRFENI